MHDELFSQYDEDPSPVPGELPDELADELPPPSPPPPPPPRRARPAARAALVGGVSGALVAAIAAFGVVRLTDHDSTPASAVVTASAMATSGFDIHSVLTKVGNSVVSIDVTEQGGFGRASSAAGSGFVVSDQGYIVTNNHVVDGASSITVTFSDGTTEAATVVGTDATHDIAVLHVGDLHGATALTLGDTSSLQVGDEVLAIGNALDLGNSPTVTLGIVSAKDRSIQTDTESLQGLIQTDAAINPGNSGGPLVDAAGQVVGINTAGVQDANNIGFAIDINTVKTVIAQLEQGATP
jgi:putative serine protease PepD